MRKEIVGGVRATQLVAGITSTAEAITIVDPTNWPDGSVGPFVVAINRGAFNEELILCQSRTGSILTVATSGRGYDGTAAAMHAIESVIEHVLDAGTVDQANEMANAIVAKGGLVTQNADGAFVTIAPAGAGDDDKVLIAKSTEASGLQLVELGTVAIELADNQVTTPKINDAAVTIVKMATNSVGSTQLADLAVTAAKIAVDAVIGANIVDGAITTAKLGDAQVTNAKLRNSTALSAIGRSANTSGDPADIVAGANHHVLRRSGTTLGFGLLTADSLDSSVLSPAVTELTMLTGWSADGKLSLRYWKVGNIVFLTGSARRTSGSDQNIATLPVGFRPSPEFKTPFSANGVSTSQVTIATGGVITATGVSGDVVISLSCFFPV